MNIVSTTTIVSNKKMFDDHFIVLINMLQIIDYIPVTVDDGVQTMCDRKYGAVFKIHAYHLRQ